MTTKFLALISVIGLVSICLVQPQLLAPSGAPAASPSPAKHRAHKKAEATASPAEEAASPSTAESPAATAPGTAASPAEKRSRKKAKTEVAASPAPSASLGKFKLGDLFKPKTSASAAPVAASPAPATRVGPEAATNPPAQGGGHGLVWVNTESHVYHREGSRFYGTTKKGKYVTEADAIKEGDRAAAKGQ